MSIRSKFILAAALTALAAAVAGQTLGAAPSGKLVATVGPDATISLTTAAGKPARVVKAGSYTVVVRDRSEEHNFVLRGPGVSKATTVAGTGSSTWRITLARGKAYAYLCAPHADAMRGSVRAR